MFEVNSGNTKKLWHLLSRGSHPSLLHVKAVLKNSANFAEKLFGELFLSMKRAPSYVCSYEFCEIFLNSYSIELLWTAALLSELIKASPEDVSINWSNLFTLSFRFFQYNNRTNIVYLLEQAQAVGLNRITFSKHDKPVFILRYERPY